jgi:hypothetical protein
MKDLIKVKELVVEFFNGDDKKVDAWFATENALLGGWSPQEMIYLGRQEKLLKFIQTSLDENKR